MMKLDGVALALSSEALRIGAFPDMPLVRKILNNFNLKRSGDIFVVFEPHWFINDFDGLTVASTHGSPWNYDTHVPVIFLGPGIPAGVIHRRVQPADVAPTLAALLGMSPPASSQGSVLPEVFRQIAVD